MFARMVGWLHILHKMTHFMITCIQSYLQVKQCFCAGNVAFKTVSGMFPGLSDPLFHRISQYRAGSK